MRAAPLPTRPQESPRGWQVIACDLDGTLIGRDHKCNDRDVAALRRAAAAGLHVAICTGRHAGECAAVTSLLDLRGPGVFVNGAMIAEMASAVSKQRHFLQPGIVERLVVFFGELGHSVLALVDQPQTHLPQYIRTEHGPPHRATVEWLIANRMNALVQREIEPALRERLVRLGIVVDVPESLAIEREIAARFGDAISSHSIYSGVYDCQVIECFAPRISKWTGIVAMCEELGLAPDHVVTIGDDVNDLAMLRNASLSFAMANGSPVVRAAAQRVTASQTDCGVAQVVEGILRGEW